jgi:hypothetical protein
MEGEAMTPASYMKDTIEMLKKENDDLRVQLRYSIPKPMVDVNVSIGQTAEHDEPDFNSVSVNKTQVVWYAGLDNDDPQMSTVDSGATLAKKLGVGLTLHIYGVVYVDDRDCAIEVDVLLEYEFADLDKVKSWRESDVLRAALGLEAKP